MSTMTAELPQRTPVPEYMTMRQAAEWFGAAHTTVQEWYDAGLLGGFRTGNHNQQDAYGRWGTKGARRICRDEDALALREAHRASKEAAAAKSSLRRPQAT